jgi:hypothetical protein
MLHALKTLFTLGGGPPTSVLAGVTFPGSNVYSFEVISCGLGMVHSHWSGVDIVSLKREASMIAATCECVNSEQADRGPQAQRKLRVPNPRRALP